MKPPAEDPKWHRVIKAWYRSLKTWGQSKFYEDSDWQSARFTAHSPHARTSFDERRPAPALPASERTNHEA